LVFSGGGGVHTTAATKPRSNALLWFAGRLSPPSAEAGNDGYLLLWKGNCAMLARSNQNTRPSKLDPTP
jgi:hypothetical protein